MKVVLAEKPSVARDIARCIGATSRRDGYLEGQDRVVTWAFGHMLELQQPDGYSPTWKRWSLETLPMVPEEFQLQARGDEGARKQLETIVRLFKEAELIVCATDAGREGELIFRYILSWADCVEKPIKRLWISSLTDAAIKDGFRNLQDGRAFDDLYRAAKCRSESDWIVGLNATRFFTVKYGKPKELWTVGRVQTPVLAMIVGRDLAIEQFKPEDYWELRTLYREATFKHDGERILEQEKADALLAQVTGSDLCITRVARQTRKFQPPFLYDLTELQREMNRRFGMTADRTLKVAQSLYERKHITYPRTDSRFLGADLKPTFPGLLKQLEPLMPEAIGGLDLANLKVTRRLVDDKKVTDHHAIIPTDQPPSRLHGDEARVYEAVATRFVAAFYPPCVKDQTTVNAVSSEVPFKASGSVIVEPGWQQLYPHMLKGKRKKAKGEGGEEPEDEEQALPAFEEGEAGPHEPFLKTLQTKPPHTFNEASLLQAMETAGKAVDDETLAEALKEKGIGTPATRASIIEVLLRRGYIARRKKSLISTQAGRTLIRMVHDDRLKSPELTGEWEHNLKLVEQGKYDPAAFMADVEEHTRRIISQTGTVERARPWLGPCPKCDGQVIEGKKGFGCSRWKAGCTWVLWKEQFGHRLRAGQVTELLERRKLKEPLLIDVEGKKVAARLTLDAEGAIGWEQPKGKFKIGDKSVLGTCPLCGSDVIESAKAYGCANWKAGCGFVVWKSMSNRTIPKEMVRVLLKNGLTPFIQKFKRRDGKRFDARLKLVDGKVEFDFTPTEKPKAGDGGSDSNG